MQRDLPQLEALLATNSNWAVSTEDDAVCVTNEDGLEAYVAVAGSQIIVETTLFSADQVKDPAGLNDEILRTHQLLPLTTIAIKNIGGQDYYMAFGALASTSKDESILVEVQTLFANVEGFLDIYDAFVK